MSVSSSATSASATSASATFSPSPPTSSFRLEEIREESEYLRQDHVDDIVEGEPIDYENHSKQGDRRNIVPDVRIELRIFDECLPERHILHEYEHAIDLLEYVHLLDESDDDRQVVGQQEGWEKDGQEDGEAGALRFRDLDASIEGKKYRENEDEVGRCSDDEFSGLLVDDRLRGKIRVIEQISEYDENRNSEDQSE